MKSRVLLRVAAAFILLGSGLISFGCTYNRMQLESGKTYTIERVESNPIYISWVRAREKNKEMIVTGLLRSHSTYTQGTGHVDVAVIGPGGEPLGKTGVDYNPKTFLRGSRGKESRFEARLPFIPPDGSRIRVTVHFSPEIEKSDL